MRGCRYRGFPFQAPASRQHTQSLGRAGFRESLRSAGFAVEFLLSRGGEDHNSFHVPTVPMVLTHFAPVAALHGNARRKWGAPPSRGQSWGFCKSTWGGSLSAGSCPAYPAPRPRSPAPESGPPQPGANANPGSIIACLRFVVRAPFSQYLDQYRSRQRTVILHEVGLLPAPAHHLPVLHGEDAVHAAQYALQMVPRVETEPAVEIQIAVVPIAVGSFGRLFRRQPLQVGQHIPLEAFDSLGDKHPSGSVGGHGPDESVAHAAVGHRALDLPGDIDHLQILARLYFDADQLHDHRPASSNASALRRKTMFRHSSEKPSASMAAAMFLISTRG